MINLFILLIGIFAAGGLGSLVLQKNQHLSHLFASVSAIAGSILGIVFSGITLLNKETQSYSLATSFPMFKISITTDSLSALFILIISIIALCCSIYGTSYMRQYFKKYNIGVFGFFYNLFILSMILVVTASNAIYFLFVWELMSLTSLFLVIFENKRLETLRSGLIYFIMTHAGTAFILFGFLALYSSSHSFDFSAIKSVSHSIPLYIKNIVFICALIGFGTKAGIIPLHIWLPKAHSSAPSHVSSLMSGVMIKLGIFMIIRLLIDMLWQTPPLWWGLTILFIGALSSVLGVLYALSEHDIKRLLAYHSIENIGIILLGVGSSIIFSSLGLHALAIISLAAGLFHTVNHAIFKSLLFLGAGSVISQTHTRDIEKYGGLIKLMPYTAIFFLIGSIAISGFPPFNGFASEWLTFQAIFAGIQSDVILIKGSFIFAAASLAITGGLAAACFVKAFGISFLARRRNASVKQIKESPLSMLTGMAILSVLSLLLGIFAFYFTPVLKTVARSVGSFQLDFVQNESYSLNMPVVFLCLLITVLITFCITYFLSRKQKIVFGDTWNCGYYSVNSRAEITSAGFARSLILIFKGILKPSRQNTVEYADANIRYFEKSKTITLSTLNICEDYIYMPVQKIMFSLSRQVKKIQSGNINQYLLYIFIIFIVLIIWARL